MSFEVVCIRLLVAAGLGVIIGLERERHGRPVGLRTNIVVAVSSCLLMILSIDLAGLFEGATSQGTLRIDPGRIASYAVAGMGFLGAGAIIQGQGRVQGLTSAASLWVSNALGLAVGAGFILPALAATVLVLIALLPLRYLAPHLSRDTDTRITLEFGNNADHIHEIVKLLTQHRVRIQYINYRNDLEKNRSAYEVGIQYHRSQSRDEVQTEMGKLADLIRLSWSQGYIG
jgi:putative Mg2+ transporter-C (MgtC) family protein